MLRVPAVQVKVENHLDTSNTNPNTLKNKTITKAKETGSLRLRKVFQRYNEENTFTTKIFGTYQQF